MGEVTFLKQREPDDEYGRALFGIGRSIVRLTRRGRVAVLLAALLTMAVLVVALGSSTTATGDAGDPVPTQTVTVQPGDTLWKLASDANPNGDIRQTVDDIMRLNSLVSASGLQMGSEVAVPIYE